VFSTSTRGKSALVSGLGRDERWLQEMQEDEEIQAVAAQAVLKQNAPGEAKEPGTGSQPEAGPEA
jgi:hypothetical protein